MASATPPSRQVAEPRKRATLVNTRSRDTRQSLVSAALLLWSEGDFGEAYEATTPADIARAAGVSKGTFYFHFANKEDLLREMLSATARAAISEVDEGTSRDVPVFPLAEQVMASMARHVAKIPKAAALRAGAVSLKSRLSQTTLTIPRGTLPAFEALVRHGMERGELRAMTDVEDAAAMLHTVTLDVIIAWGQEDRSADWLRQRLCGRVQIVLRGLSAITADG
jgi:AcrR family transcriptional regulator